MRGKERDREKEREEKDSLRGSERERDRVRVKQRVSVRGERDSVGTGRRERMWEKEGERDRVRGNERDTVRGKERRIVWERRGGKEEERYCKRKWEGGHKRCTVNKQIGYFTYITCYRTLRRRNNASLQSEVKQHITMQKTRGSHRVILHEEETQYYLLKNLSVIYCGGGDAAVVAGRYWPQRVSKKTLQPRLRGLRSDALSTVVKENEITSTYTYWKYSHIHGFEFLHTPTQGELTQMYEVNARTIHGKRSRRALNILVR